MIQLFPGIPAIKSKAKRRSVMVLAGPLLFAEYVINGGLLFFREFRACWNIDHTA